MYITCEYHVRKAETIGHSPTPEGPFRYLIFDFIDIIKPVQGKKAHVGYSVQIQSLDR